MRDERWRGLAAQQAGLVTRAQLRELGIERWTVNHRIATERWAEPSSTVVATTTGALTRRQLMWLGVLHAGGESLVGDLSAAEVHGLRNWHRDDVVVWTRRGLDVGDEPLPGIRFVETRRPLHLMRNRQSVLPLARLEPAVLRFAAYQRSTRTAEGVLAAVVQQQLTNPAALLDWVDLMQPLRWSKRFKRALGEIAGGAQSTAEIDVRRMCRSFGLAMPVRQTKRRDASGRWRYTDNDWKRPDGRTVVLEVDGAFHMDVDHWEDDLARQRALTTPDRMIVRCTARELRDEPWAVARDLKALGVPAAA
ncbi:hypothetical protein F0U44_10980 [Nocardioides humilatus]|uniref:DUF559 domain-containing protein n=1 Tax=Nocardioides humilatus TaxID=2607660 RepID=A0A5B1LE24_9ACTN|nr:hypothetical protein [Nocardioides humilatus]KAA1418981.1 hypothetical protein F0U44_10980 [Nocardioides humilatus]